MIKFAAFVVLFCIWLALTIWLVRGLIKTGRYPSWRMMIITVFGYIAIVFASLQVFGTA
ncbi:MAG: hypothetical protein AAGF35_13105 [Pseudomonadota bacterium]